MVWRAIARAGKSQTEQNTRSEPLFPFGRGMPAGSNHHPPCPRTKTTAGTGSRVRENATLRKNEREYEHDGEGWSAAGWRPIPRTRAARARAERRCGQEVTALSFKGFNLISPPCPPTLTQPLRLLPPPPHPTPCTSDPSFRWRSLPAQTHRPLARGRDRRPARFFSGLTLRRWKNCCGSC